MCDNNPFSELFRDNVQAAELAAATKLHLTTAFKALHDPQGRFNEETAKILARWATTQVGSCEIEDLFAPDNLTFSGRLPLSGEPIGPKDRKMTCPKCYLETRIAAQCVNCDALLSQIA
jgi:hypothetical protein